MSSFFGTILKVSTFGESHGYGIGAILDGCPSGIYLNIDDIQPQVNRRRSSKDIFSTSREEKDIVLIFSGINNGKTIGSPIGIFIKNKNFKKSDYEFINEIPRPSHSDYTYGIKYGRHAVMSGGGRSSARETLARVAVGAIAEKFLKDLYGIKIVAWVSKIGNVILPYEYSSISKKDVDYSLVRCPDFEISDRMLKLLMKVKKEKDSIGGIITCLCQNVPSGWGEPVFDKLDAVLSHAIMSIPATKGFEIGSGFSSTSMNGSNHNDVFRSIHKEIRLKTNRSGGIQGGISTGDNIIFRVAFKPPSSIGLTQKTVDYNGNRVFFKLKGRHDSCIVPRAVPVVEAMTALVLGDFAMRDNKIF